MGKTRKSKSSSENISTTEEPREVMLKEMEEIGYDSTCILYQKIYLFLFGSYRSCFVRKGVFRNFAKFTGKNTYQSLRPATLFKKETLAQVLSCESCKTSTNTFLKEHLWVTASEHYFVNMLFSYPRFDRKTFGDCLIESVKFRKNRAKSSRKMRCCRHYCLWARCLYRKEIGNEEQTFSYPASVLQYIKILSTGEYG